MRPSFVIEDGSPPPPYQGCRVVRVHSNMRLLLTRFELVGKEHSPCGSRSRATSIAAQQNR